MKTIRYQYLAFCAFLISSALSFAQAPIEYSIPQRGTVPSGTYALSKIETVDAVSGNLSLHIPITSLPAGRGGFSTAVDLYYNSSTFVTKEDDSYIPTDGQPAYFLGAADRYVDQSEVGGWRYGYQYTFITDSMGSAACGSQDVTYTRYRVVLPDGSSHVLFITGKSDWLGLYGYGRDTNCNYYHESGIENLFTADGSYLRMNWNADSGDWTLYFPDGRKVKGGGAIEYGNGMNVGVFSQATDLYDRNSNHIQISNVTDSGVLTTKLTDDSGRIIKIQRPQNYSGDVITQAGYGGQQLQWNITWGNNDITSSPSHTYHCRIVDCNATGFGGHVITSISLPNNLSYRFCYDGASTPASHCSGKPYTDATQWGQLSDIMLPSTATAMLPSQAQVHYTYQQPTFSYGNHSWNFRVTSKTLTWTDDLDSSQRTETSTYSYTNSSSVFTNPDGGQITHYFYDLDNEQYKWYVGLVFKTVSSPSGDVQEQFWATNIPFGSTQGLQGGPIPGAGNPYVETELKSIGPSGSPSLTSAKAYRYDRNGNATVVSEYDWFPYNGVGHTGNSSPPSSPNLPSTNLIRGQSIYFVRQAGIATSSGSNLDDPLAYWNTQTPQLLRLTCQTIVSGTPGALTQYVYDTNSFDSLNCFDSHNGVISKGNLTGVRQWDITRGGQTFPLDGTNSILTTTRYDDQYGNIISTTNARGYQTTYSYDSASVLDCPSQNPAIDATNLYVSQITVAGLRHYTFTHDCSTGVKKGDNDGEHPMPRTYGYDTFARLASVSENSVRNTTTVYNDSARQITGNKIDVAGVDPTLVDNTYVDQLGRVYKTVDPAGNIVQNRYYVGSVGNTCQEDFTLAVFDLVSNPYVSGSESTMGWTRTTRDTLGRVIQVRHYPGSQLPQPWGGNCTLTGKVTTGYAANTSTNTFCSTTTDEANVSRTSCSDALGRLKSVTETGISATTTYAYDSLDDLIAVCQGGTLSGTTCTGSGAVGRSFTYSSLKRLISANNPESGSISYVYDPNGNVHFRTDARGYVTTYNYDELDQLASKLYSDGTTQVTYGYNNSWLSRVSAGSTSYNYTKWDGLGRVTEANQTTNNTVYSFTLKHHPFVGLDWITYPNSNRTITIGYNTVGQAQSLSGQIGTGSSTNYITGASYAPHGSIQALTLHGNSNGVTDRTCFNSRLQISGIRVAPNGPTDCTAASTDLLNLAYDYGTTANNGNVLTQTITRGSSAWTQNYTYDGANRLNCSNEVTGSTVQPCNTGSQSWLQTYGYDTRGNRWLNSLGPINQTAETIVSNAFNTSNRVSTWDSPTCYNSANCYDKSGNLLVIPATGGGVVRTATYDAENRMTSATVGSNTTTYVYDGDGRRIQKVTPSGTTTFIYDPFGKLAQEYGASTDTGTKYLHTDSIGSIRLETDSSGAVARCYDYLPFGEEIGNSTSNRGSCFGGSTYPASADVISTKFTGKERDTETGLDYFGARYMSSAEGRFVSPDWSEKPEPIPYASLSNPQTLNLYAYVQNNPLSNKDDDGHCVVDGEEHNFGWCAAHFFGFNQTKAEENAENERQREWLAENVATSDEQRFAVKSASSAQVKQLYGQWNFAILSAQLAGGAEMAYDASNFKRAEDGSLVFYRGGGDLTPRIGIDVVIDKKTGLLKGDGKSGMSVNIDPDAVRFKGIPHQLMYLPPELHVVQRGKPGHYQIEPRMLVTLERFVELLSGTVLKAIE